MSDYNLRQVLIEREGLSPGLADIQIAAMRQEVANGADPEELLYEIGLEPDYVEDLIDMGWGMTK